jgi:nucleoside phosphorylase
VAARSSLGGALVVAATSEELKGIGGAQTLCCGIGPVEAACATARALAQRKPGVVVHIGIAGARRFAVPSLVLGSESRYCDLHTGPQWALPLIARLLPDADLLRCAREVLPNAELAVIGTSARIGGAADCEVEAMEGFGVLRASAAAGVAALELRAISNRYADPRERWQIADAIALLAPAVETLLGALGA